MKSKTITAHYLKHRLANNNCNVTSFSSQCSMHKKIYLVSKLVPLILKRLFGISWIIRYVRKNCLSLFDMLGRPVSKLDLSEVAAPCMLFLLTYIATTISYRVTISMVVSSNLDC